MQRKLLTILFACLLVLTARADQEAKGDSIYEQMVEWSLTGKRKEMLANEERALRFFYDNSQWEHYYYISTLCNANKVLENGLVMSSLRDCRKLYQFARDNKHDYGRGIVLAQIGWLYGFMGDHEESVRQMEEAFRIFRHHPLNRDVIGLLYYYAYNLELTGRYDEETRVLAIMKPMIQHYDWGNTSPIVQKSCRDNLLNAEALLEVRKGNLNKAEYLITQLQAKIANHDEQNEYEALRAIAEYYRARGEYALALASTDRMLPLATNTGLQWGLTLLRTDLLRHVGRTDEAYDLLRPMIEQRSDDHMGQLRRQLNEMDAMAEIDDLNIHREHMQFWYAVGIAFVLLCGLGVYTVSRHRAARKLKHANQQLRKAYDQLEETTKAKERIESDLRIARDIQMSMLPSEFPRCDRLDIYGTMTPAKQVGGDLYDVMLIDAHLLYFCVADVSGKGVPASLFMAQTIRLYRALAKLKVKPADIATYMNSELSDRNDSSMFVTMFMGCIDLDTATLEFCNCGHNPPVIGCGSAEAHFLEMLSNAPIGLFPDMEYQGETIDDIKGKPLFIYTDGLNEAENLELQQFGEDRLLGILQQTPFSSPRHLIDQMTRQVELHRNGAEPNDDLTMLCLCCYA